MKLYGMVVSPFVGRVMLAAKLKGIDLPLVAPPTDETMPLMMQRLQTLMKDPKAELPTIQIMAGTKFMKEINPLGRIPALEVDGKYLAESTTICEYLEDRFPSIPLLPADPFDRAKVRQLCRMTDLYVTPQAWQLPGHIDPLTRDDKKVAELRAYLKISLWELEQVMGPGPWAYGNSATLADVVMTYTFLVIQNILYVTSEQLGFTSFNPKNPFPENPKLAAWWKHLEGHDVFGAAIRDFHKTHEETFGAMLPDRSPAMYGMFMRARSPRP